MTFLNSEKNNFLSSFANNRSLTNEWNGLQTVLTKPYQRRYCEIEHKFHSSCSVCTVQREGSLAWLIFHTRFTLLVKKQTGISYTDFMEEFRSSTSEAPWSCALYKGLVSYSSNLQITASWEQTGFFSDLSSYLAQYPSTSTNSSTLSIPVYSFQLCLLIKPVSPYMLKWLHNTNCQKAPERN